MTKLFDSFNEDEIKTNADLEVQFDTLEHKLKELKIRYGLGEINKEIYELTQNYLVDQITCVNKELHRTDLLAHNLESLISTVVEGLNQLSEV